MSFCVIYILLITTFSRIALSLWLGRSDEGHTVARLNAEYYSKIGRTIDSGWIVFVYKVSLSRFISTSIAFQGHSGTHIPAILLTLVFDALTIAFISTAAALAVQTFNYVSIAFSLSPFTKDIHTRLLATIGLQVMVQNLSADFTLFSFVKTITYQQFSDVGNNCVRLASFISQHDSAYIRLRCPASC